MLAKKIGSFTETLREQTPQPLPADLAARAVESSHDAFWMFGIRLPNLRAQFHPIAHRIDLAKRHAGLNHSPRPGIHSKENHLLRPRAKRAHVGFMARPRVIEGIINVRYGRREL